MGAPATNGDGKLAVTGTARIDTEKDTIYTEKYSADNGLVLWAAPDTWEAYNCKRRGSTKIPAS